MACKCKCKLNKTDRYKEALKLIKSYGGNILKLESSLIDYNLCRLAFPFETSRRAFDMQPKNIAIKKYNKFLKSKILHMLINTL